MTATRSQVPSAAPESDERFALLVDSVRDYAIFMLDRTGRVESWNRGAERLKGYTAAEILGRHLSVFYPPEAIASGLAERELAEAERFGRFEDEGWRVRKDGTRFWANVVLTAMRDSSGRLRGFAKVTRDMTDRKRVEEQLREQARQQSAVADLGVYALTARDLQPVVDHAARVVTRTLGTELSAVLELVPDGSALVMRAGDGWGEGVVGSATIAADKSTHAGQALLSREPVLVEDLAHDARFVPSPVLASHGATSGVGVLIFAAGDDGRPYGALTTYARTPRTFLPSEVAFLQGVANVVAAAIARRWADEQLHRARAQAEQERLRAVQAQEAIRERDEFMSVASHELRTPLTALHLHLQAVHAGMKRAPGVIDDQLKAKLDRAIYQTERMGGLIERLLDLSRLAVGRLSIAAEPGDLRELAAEVIDAFQPQAEKAGSVITLRAPEPVVGSWDRFRIEQVFTNLLSNAVKYGRGQAIEVAIETRGDRARVMVRDHGIGIAGEDRDRIFQRFERASSVRNYGGLGLGLYISRQLVEAHGGQITVESQPGAGSTFTVDLPLRPP